MEMKVRMVVEFMKANLHRELTLDEIATAVRLSRSRVCNLVKSETGMSPGQCFKHLKLRKAGELLQTTLLSVKEITALIGIKNQSHFNRDFKKFYGVSPCQYRANHNASKFVENAPISKIVKSAYK